MKNLTCTTNRWNYSQRKETEAHSKSNFRRYQTLLLEQAIIMNQILFAYNQWIRQKKKKGIDNRGNERLNWKTLLVANLNVSRHIRHFCLVIQTHTRMCPSEPLICAIHRRQAHYQLQKCEEMLTEVLFQAKVINTPIWHWGCLTALKINVTKANQFYINTKW